MEKQFRVLRIVGSFYKIVGIIIGVVTIITALGFCVMSVVSGSATETILHSLNPSGSIQGFGLLGGVVGGVVISLATILFGGIYAVSVYALGEGVYLLIALEENTRRMTSLLHRHLDRDQSQPLAPPPSDPAPFQNRG